jgi:protein-S-isoprenylcysteine O-methyltransferase Ste14
VAVGVVLAVMGMQLVVIPFEERRMEEDFGQSYATIVDGCGGGSRMLS